MNIQFTKDAEGGVVASADGHTFSSSDYIEIVKLLHSGEKISGEFSAEITDEEKDSLSKMITSINIVDSKTDQPQVQASTAVVYPEEEINPEDIPF